jgi:small GTP-binding protein
MGLFNLKKDEINLLKKEILKALTINPPTIGLVGVSGVGKSTTINTLFKTDLKVSDTIACTKDFETIPLELKFNNDNIKDFGTKLQIIDAPGLGEDINLDVNYIHRYKENLEQCDVILWIMTGRNRAVALDQQYLKELSDFHTKIIFGINQVELIEPQDWNAKINLPSKKQLKNINIIEKDRKEKIEKTLQREIRICSYSAKAKYNLEELFGLLIDSCPENRKWIFNELKGFHYKDFLPENVREQFKTDEI